MIRLGSNKRNQDATEIPLDESGGRPTTAGSFDADESLLQSQHKKFREFICQYQINQRCCACYIEDEQLKLKKPSAEPTCQCGRLKRNHQSSALALHSSASDKIWSPDQHTLAQRTETFGEVAFFGFGSSTDISPYIRCDHQTSAELLWKLLTDVWELPPPKLVISVTGGAKKFNMRARLAQAFKTGLVNAAKSTGAWIITGGTATGVMKYVGEAMQEYTMAGSNEATELVALGIVSYGIVDNKDVLDGKQGHGLFPATYNLKHCTNASKAPLDHNHTHFILVDNGTEGRYGVEIPLRAQLENYISDHVTNQATYKNVSTPVVLIVCEGGMGTLDQAYSAIMLGVPLVVVVGSGRAAEVIATAYKVTAWKYNESRSQIPPHFDDQMSGEIQRNLSTPDSEIPIAKMQECLEKLKNMMAASKRNLITLYDLSDENNKEMDQAILKALMKARQSDAQSQVSLALVWNRSDVARQEIFIAENRAAWQKVDLDAAMLEALLNDRVEFVQLFLDNGVQLRTFVTLERLNELYRRSLADKSNTIVTILEELDNRIRYYRKYFLPWRRQRRVWSENYSRTGSLTTELEQMGTLIVQLLDNEVDSIYEESVLRDAAKAGQFNYPARELFLWALLFMKLESAQLLWKHVRDPIGGALVASRMLYRLSREAQLQEEIDICTVLRKEADA